MSRMLKAEDSSQDEKSSDWLPIICKVYRVMTEMLFNLLIQFAVNLIVKFY